MNSLRAPELHLTSRITVARHCIKPTWTDEPDRFEVTPVKLDLLRPATTVDLTSCRPAAAPPCQAVPLTVGYPHPPRQYGHLVFAVSTVHERLEDALAQISHWMSGSGATLVAVVNDASSANDEILQSLEQLFLKRDITLKAVAPLTVGRSVDTNHFTMITSALEAATRATQWLVLLDDDTFFPSLYNIDRMLRKYDHRKPAWLGALSEDRDAVARRGHMAFGGAGVFLSVPLARELAPHVDDCVGAARLKTGDGMLRDCIADHTNVTLQVVAGLRQHDLHGDVSGFYESGARPLSVHHWRSWYRDPLPQMAAITTVCGDCFLQRWQFGRDTLLANGYSITHYPRGLGRYNLTLMEGTWDQADASFNESMGLLRPKLGAEEKVSYKLVQTRRLRDGALVQVYLKRGDEARGEVDKVVELSWPAPLPGG